MSCGTTLSGDLRRLRPVDVQLGQADAGDLAVLGAHAHLDVAQAAGRAPGRCRPRSTPAPTPAVAPTLTVAGRLAVALAAGAVAEHDAEADGRGDDDRRRHYRRALHGRGEVASGHGATLLALELEVFVMDALVRTPSRRACAMSCSMNPLGPQTYRSRPAMSGTRRCRWAASRGCSAREPDDLVQAAAAHADELRDLVAQHEVVGRRAAQQDDHVDVPRQVFEHGPHRRRADAGGHQQHAVGVAGVLREGAVRAPRSPPACPGVSWASAELCSPAALTVMRISLPPGSAETE